jgi:SecD/SecF fusion protein
MNRTDQWKLASVLLVTAIAVWYLFPSYQFYANYYNRTTQQLASVSSEKLAALRKKAIHLGLDLQGGMHLVLEVDRSKMNAAEGKDAVDRAMEVLRQRIDQFGVAEPLIQKEGEDRIVIQLPGLTDRKRALDLIGKTALLEFKLVRTAEETKNVFDKLDSYLATHATVADTALRRTALSSHVLSMDFAAFVRSEDLPAVQQLLATPGLDSIIPGDAQLLWGTPDEASQGVTGRYLYVVKREPEMKGGSIATANAQIGLESASPGAWGVSMKMTPSGRIDFARITGANVGRNLAIVLDGVISSAPTIRDRIPTGDASITGGSFNVETARDLAIVLRAGALPAPVHIVEERSVGTIMVIVFMLVYYQLSGLIAVVAMVLNIFYLLACLAGLGATLTLPGIAGMVLTVGMAVDANVLIFERIREELRNQKSVRQAVQLGYDRAFRTIFDANVTTIISSVFLFQFGTGPIKGFAITMIIGLIANLFTAVFLTRMVFDFMLSRGKAETLSI